MRQFTKKRPDCKTPQSATVASIPFVIPPRFELGTHSLEGCCSIQLSYGTSISACKDSEKKANGNTLAL